MGQPEPIAEGLTFDDFLVFEENAETKHEYIGGLIYDMAGASRNHNLICMNLSGHLFNHLRGTSCNAFMADMLLRLRIGEDDIAYYPDLMVGCDPNDNHKRYLTQPSLIIEVLSESTKRTDLREKFLAYQSIDNVREYVTVKQDEMDITLFRRDNNWQAEHFRADQTLIIPSLKFEVAVSEVYEGLEFSNSTTTS